MLRSLLDGQAPDGRVLVAPVLRGDSRGRLPARRATTGLRRGEVLGLSWGSLDLDNATLSVTRTLVDLDGDQPVWTQPVWSDPKTVRGRRNIALDPATVAVLRTVRTQQLQERLFVGAA